MKSILVVLDGMGDRPDQRIGGRSAVEAASTPVMDSLARRGSCGMIDILGGVAPESDSAVLSLLGYDPHKCYTGRGPLEAVGMGMRMRQGMLALRCNFATTSDGRDLVDRRVARSLTSSEAAQIAAAVSRRVKLKGAGFQLRAGVAHRAVLLISAKRHLSSKITNTDPAYAVGKNRVPEALARFDMRIMDCRPLEKRAVPSAGLVNDFTRQCFSVLRNHPVNVKRVKKGLLPANIIISRDAGDRLPALRSISDRFRRKFAILADMPMEVGIGKLCGMSIVKLPTPTFAASDHALRVRKAISALKKYDSLYIHIKGPDNYGHEGDLQGKIRCLGEVDRFFFAPLIRQLDMRSTVIAVTADHATPCSLKGHSGDAVPFLISGGRVERDSVQGFSERECAKGGYGKIRATRLMHEIMRFV